MLNCDATTSTFVFPQGNTGMMSKMVTGLGHITTRVTTPWIFSGGRE